MAILTVPDDQHLAVKKDFQQLKRIVRRYAKTTPKKIFWYELCPIAVLVVIGLFISLALGFAAGAVIPGLICAAVTVTGAGYLFPESHWNNDWVTGCDLNTVAGMSEFTKSLLVEPMKASGGKLSYTQLETLISVLTPEMDRLEVNHRVCKTLSLSQKKPVDFSG